MSLDLGTLVQYVELDPTAFNRRYAEIAADLDRLRRTDADVRVGADTSQAQAGLAGIEAQAQALPPISIQVGADTGAAESAVNDIAAESADALGDAGAEGGQKMGAGIIAALTALPIAGTVIALGAVAGRALLEGLENEVREDRLAALTGLDGAAVKRFATAAGEAYASNFGDSIADNMDIARVALQTGLLGDGSTSRDAQKLIEQLATVSDLLGEDVANVARTTGLLLRNGLAKDAAGAFDILVRGVQTGANAAEDLLDTLGEYGSTLRGLGLEGDQALGLLNQGPAAGAPNTDFFADALRELGIRIREGNDDTSKWLSTIGLVPGELQAAFVAGGPKAAEGLDRLFDSLRAVEDPVLRNQAAVGILGTQFEDLQLDLDKLDPSKAVEQLGKVQGAAEGAIATLGDNTAGQLASAQRNIEVAADGIKGALAAAFGDEIQDFATFVQANRAAMVEFLLDLARAEAERLIGTYGAVPPVKQTDFIANTAQAVAAVADLQRRIDNIRSANVNITATTALSLVRQEDAMANRLPGRASGGALPYFLKEETRP